MKTTLSIIVGFVAFEHLAFFNSGNVFVGQGPSGKRFLI